jgi:hypothetical protein
MFEWLAVCTRLDHHDVEADAQFCELALRLQ